jgi:hypothetical protein
MTDFTEEPLGPGWCELDRVIESPLFSKEFGFPVYLHDARIVACESIRVAGQLPDMQFVLDVPKQLGLEVSFVRYTLLFQSVEESLGQRIVGCEIYRMRIKQETNHLRVWLYLLPEGFSIEFECLAIRELSIRET